MALMSSAFVAGPASGQVEAESAAVQKELAALRAENARLRAKVAALEAQLAAMRAEKQRAEQQVAAAESEQRDYHLDIERDSEAGPTTIRSRTVELRTNRNKPWRRHWMHIEAERAADGKPRHVHLKIQTFATGKVYDRLETVTLTAGDTQIEAEVVDYDSQLSRSGGAKNRKRTDDETITAALTLDELRQLAAASQVTGRLGTRDFHFARDHINALRALEAELDSAD
jgi:hypothetical protein